ncbi:MAG: hypothetical protein E6Q97_36805 [Desulfurellales bacterium]|nr:MAG: hypothetical protein E6Q97_36805 [Desulfurellales bacterium]
MPDLPNTPSHYLQAGRPRQEDEAVRPLQGASESPAPEAQRPVQGQGPIEVRIAPVVGITSSTWGLRAYIWEKLVEAGVPLLPSPNLHSDPIPSRGTLTSSDDWGTGVKVFRWTP